MQIACPTLVLHLLFLPNAVFARQAEETVDGSDTLEQVIITAPMIQKSIMKLPTSYQRVPINATINRAGNSPVPALNTIAGVYVQSGALNTNRITIRGVGSRNPFGTNRIKAYYAGIPLTGGDGETELDDISAEIVSSVEVLKGGKSAFYGAGLGGVILLNPSNAVPTGGKLSVSTNFGSDGLRRFGVTASIGSQKSQSFLNISDYKLEGWRGNSRYDRTSFLFTHEQKIGVHKVQVLVTGQRVDAEIPSSLNEIDFKNSPEVAAFTWNRVNGREDNDKLLVGISANLHYNSSWKQQIIVFGNYYSGKEFRPFNDLDDDSRRLGFRTLLEFEQNRLKLQVVSEAFLERYNASLFQQGTDTLLSE
ncbi:MAG: TonB-dependent receptor, partial [Bacteroidota bacterium]